MFCISNKFIFGTSALITILQFVAYTKAQEECESSVLTCYECDSRTDHNCDDPFNKTLPPENLPDMKECKGCCVKLVRKFAHEKWVERKCTGDMEMDFPVYHVCTAEGKGRGHLCICEDDLCNNGPGCYSSHFNLLLSIFFGFILM